MYSRPEDGFTFLELDGVELMLEEIESGQTAAGQGWNSERLEYPFARGVNLQINVASVVEICRKVIEGRWPVFLAVHDAWYRTIDTEHGNRQFLVIDPDGNQLRSFTLFGERSVQNPIGGVDL